MSARILFLQLLIVKFGVTFLLAEERKQVDLIFDRNEFTIISDDAGVYSIIALSRDFYYPEDSSLPEIPLTSVRVLAPNGAKLIDYKLELFEDVEATDIIIKQSPNLVPTNLMDTVEYRSGEYTNIYPLEPVQYVSTLIQRGVTCFSFMVSPFRYDKSRRELVFIKRIKLEVNYMVDRSNAPLIRQDFASKRWLKSRIINPEDLDKFYPHSAKHFLKLEKENIDYLIITNEELKTEFASLLEWKTRKGLSVDIVTIEEIDEQYAETSIQLKIKRCLQDCYQKNALRWALLAGDHGIVPAQQCFAEINSGSLRVNDTTIPADLFYACFDKKFDWNSCPNGRTGERYADGVDIIPEIYISRIPVRTREQARAFVTKILNYETGQFVANYNGGLLLAGVKICTSWDGKSDSHHRSEFLYNNYISENFIGKKIGFFDTGTDFPAGEDYHVTCSNLSAQMGSGYGIIHFAGHGNRWGMRMESGKRFTPGDASEITNPPVGIFLSTSCDASRFDMDDPCLAGALLGNPDGGCVAFFGSSRMGISNNNHSNRLGPSFNFNASFFKYLLEERTETGANSFAEISSKAKTEFADRGAHGESYHYLLYALNALGDPEMPIYTSGPFVFDNVQIERSENTISVNTGGIKSTICVTGQNLELGYQEVAENVTSTIFHDLPDSLQVTITAPDMIPYREYLTGENSGELPAGQKELFDSDFKIYPNPVTDQLHIRPLRFIPYSVSMHNSLGQVLCHIASGYDETEIDFSSFQKGIYFVKINTRGYQWTEKLVKL